MYHEGQKIVWLTLIEGKVTKVIGEITQIVGEWIFAKGKTRYGLEVTDRLTIHDCANCCHPSGELKFFLLADEDDNTAEFETEEAAKQWCADAGNEGPLAYTILCTDDFYYA